LTSDAESVAYARHEYESIPSKEDYISYVPKNFTDASSSTRLESSLFHACGIGYEADYVRILGGPEYSGENQSTITITYAYENNVWVVAGIYIP
jgi:hypothetical protein